MDHHRDVHVVESALPDERHLAAAAFLRRRADRGEAAGHLVHHGAHADGRGHADHRDEVVAARVADLSEGVVLLKDRDGRARAAAFRIAAI